MTNLRRVGNFVVSRKQLRLLLLVIGLCATCYFVLASVIAGAYYREIAFASQDLQIQPEFLQRLYSVMQTSILAITITAIVLTVLTTVAAVIITHRFYGPLVPIRRFIASVRDGDYSARLSLRTADEFHDLAEELNEMVKTLEARHGSK